MSDPVALWSKGGRRQWTLCLRTEARAAAGDTEALHDFRVALRRSRVWLRVSEPLFVDYPLKRWERTLQTIQKALGPARDADVAIALAARSQCASRKALALLEKNRWRSKESAGAILKSILWARMKDRLKQFWKESPLTARFDERDLLQRVRKIWNKTIRRLKRRVRNVDPADTQRIHQLRIGLRRLRYLAEFTDPFTGGDLKRLADELKKWQDVLGDLHDLDVVLSVASETKDENFRRIREEMEKRRIRRARSLPRALRSLRQSLKGRFVWRWVTYSPV